ncbi:MAG: diguanylate cyclase [Tissierellaceae bacterium]|nr:diguanylate cyclase [Tissierellaceae bacterium]
MHEGNFETNGVIQIVMNREHKICYSNIEYRMTYDYLKELNILENLAVDLPIQYTSDNYFVNIDGFYITDQLYYIIVINPKNYKCCNCNKALIDTATGLYNRNYWEQMNSEFFCHPELKDISVILIDIDNLKKINDNYGHLAGDKAIEIVGQAIKRSIRKEDLGIRYGGDEFLVLLHKQGKKGLNKVIQRIEKEINKSTMEVNADIHVSAGIACSEYFDNLKEMIKTADKDLYKEKRTKQEENRIEANDLKNLKQNIEKMKNELDRKIPKDGSNASSKEVLKLSRELDRLIVKYLNNV